MAETKNPIIKEIEKKEERPIEKITNMINPFKNESL